MGNILKFVGKFGKGFATIAGGVLGVGGIALGGGDELSKCFTALSHQPAEGAAMIGVLMAVFGIGRKAGWIAGGGK